MPSRKRARRSYARRFFWLSVFIVAAILAYTAAWFFAANTLEKRASAALIAANQNNKRADCSVPTARGYPFRIGLFCESISYEDPANGLAISAGAFRSAAQVYQPMRVVGELEGPAHLNFSPIPALKANWENMRLSTRLAAPLPESFSSEAHKVVFSQDGENGAALGQADELQAHARQNGTDLDLALILKRLSITPEIIDGISLPPLNGEIVLRLHKGMAAPVRGLADLRGRSGTLQNLALNASDSETGIVLKGPVEIGDDGRINAQLTLTVTDPATIAELAARAFPQSRDQVQMARTALSGLGDTPTLPVNIRQSRVFIGFLPLGEIPPI